MQEPIFDCLDLCCGRPENCTRMCPNAPERFVIQSREIGGFEFKNVPNAPKSDTCITDDLAEMVYHGSSRSSYLNLPVIALRLADLIDFQRKCLRFESRLELCDFFKIEPSCKIILSGVDHDARIEKWWALEDQRAVIIREMSSLGIELITTPNYSLLLDNPRTDDLHSMKRIALCYAEFQLNGVACALHVNGRTPMDFERWKEFISSHAEVTTLAYEFITGSKQNERRYFHLNSLAYLASSCDRDLDIIVRGDPNIIPFLKKHFRRVMYIDTNAFIKTQKRKKAERFFNHKLEWVPSPTEIGQPLDTLLLHNIDEQFELLRTAYFTKEYEKLRAA